MKKYITPNIKAVKLSAEQAILEVCQIGGGWFGNTLNGYCEAYRPTATGICSYPVRSVVNGNVSFNASPGHNHPS
ncbi:MAG: hypothetical protein PHQ52_07085 [Candidatus Omnitrophica bacterium]|nr:hypothetical protein [Candidatus Omnitrophota bacterium]